eukprot:Gb_08819 [translate_table: standard]
MVNNRYMWKHLGVPCHTQCSHENGLGTYIGDVSIGTYGIQDDPSILGHPQASQIDMEFFTIGFGTWQQLRGAPDRGEGRQGGEGEGDADMERRTGEYGSRTERETSLFSNIGRWQGERPPFPPPRGGTGYSLYPLWRREGRRREKGRGPRAGSGGTGWGAEGGSASAPKKRQRAGSEGRRAEVQGGQEAEGGMHTGAY